MSKFTKFLVPFLLIALLFAQILPMHAASAETLPEIPLSLHGLFTEAGRADTMHLITIGMPGNKGYLEYRGNPSLEFDNVVCMLNQDNALTTYYVGEDNRVYLEDEQDHRFVEPAYSVEEQYFDYAPAPLMAQVDNGCVIAVPKDMCGLALVSFRSGVEYNSAFIPFSTHVTDLRGIAAKYIENNKGEYYLLGTFGDIWCVSVEISGHGDEIIINEPEKIIDTNIPETEAEGFYYDGKLIYRTYYSYNNNSSCLMAIDPETKSIYNYGVLEEGVTIWGLYEMGEMAPNCNDAPEPIDTLDATISGLFQQDGQGDNRLVTIKTKDMKNYKQHLEFRGNPDLVLENVVCQMNPLGEVETYYIGADDYIYVEDEQDHHFLNQTPIALREQHCDYAPGPLDYQRTNGWIVGIDGHNSGLTLTSLYTGDDSGFIALQNCIDPALIAAKKLTGSKAEYYILDRAGEIWSVTISFPDFTVVEEKEIQDTCIYPDGNYDGFYFDGTWLFRTYQKDNSSVVTAYHPETDILYDLGILEPGMTVYGLYEAGKIPTVEPHEHDWEFDQFVWDTELGYKAHAVYTCSICGEETEVEATVTQLSHGIVSEFEAAIRADEAPDGEERTDTMEILPAFGGFEWDTTNGVKAYAIYVCKVFGCYDHQYRVQATVTKVNPYTVVPKYKAVVTAEQAPDGVERTETKTVIKKSDSKWKNELTPVKPFDPIAKPIFPRLP